MRRVLLDQNAPRGPRLTLADHDVQTAYGLGWRTLSNGELPHAAEREGFEVLVTCDQNIEHQNRLYGQRLALVVLSTTHWPTIHANPQPVRDAIASATPGSYAVVSLPRPRPRRKLRPCDGTG